MSKKFLLIPTLVLCIFFALCIWLWPKSDARSASFKFAIASASVVNANSPASNDDLDVYLLLKDYTFFPLKTDPQWDERRATLNPNRTLIIVEEHQDGTNHQIVISKDGKNWKVVCTECIYAVWISNTQLTYVSRLDDSFYVYGKTPEEKAYVQNVFTGKTTELAWSAAPEWQKRLEIDAFDLNEFTSEHPHIHIDCGYPSTYMVEGVYLLFARGQSLCRSTEPDRYYLVTPDGEMHEQTLWLDDLWEVIDKP